jgi:hypothetical protein
MDGSQNPMEQIALCHSDDASIAPMRDLHGGALMVFDVDSYESSPTSNYIFPKEYAGENYNSWVIALFAGKLIVIKQKKLSKEGQLGFYSVILFVIFCCSFWTK